MSRFFLSEISNTTSRGSPFGTMTRPCLHFAFNEAWLDAGQHGSGQPPSEESLMHSQVSSVRDGRRFSESYPDGAARLVYHAGTGDNGMFVRDGEELWYGPDGELERRRVYERGRLVVDEPRP